VLVFEDRDDTAAAMYMQSQHVTLAGQSSASSSELAPAIGSLSFVAARVIGRISEPLSCARPACGERPTRRSCGRAAGRGVAAPGSTRRLAEAAWSRRDTKLESQWHGTRLRSAGEPPKAASAPSRALGKRPSKCRCSGNGQRATGDAALAGRLRRCCCWLPAVPRSRPSAHCEGCAGVLGRQGDGCDRREGSLEWRRGQGCRVSGGGRLSSRRAAANGAHTPLLRAP
jgi:hypothetical protein